MRMPQPGLAVQRSPQSIQRRCRTCEEETHRQPIPHEEGDVVHAKLADNATASGGSAGVESYLNTRGASQPLPESVRAFFEPRFGYDL
jgi:hypothetical protein